MLKQEPWIALDNCDNPTTHVQKITYRDTKPPVFTTTPTDITVDCSNVTPAEDLQAIDNCGTVFIAFNEAFLPYLCGELHPHSYMVSSR
ncbi:MAG: hypothetical protein IPJ06_05325 [Saprospiraceae bacterium]|nr:hypothetical protein [Saprospiraceae bacterium]